MTGTCALLLGAVYVFGAAGLEGKQGQGGKRLWVLSIGVGAMYGALFTLTVCSSFFPFALFILFTFLEADKMFVHCSPRLYHFISGRPILV